MHVQAFEQHPHAKQAQVLRACIRVHAWARPCARAWRAHGPVSTDQAQAPRLHAHTQQQHLPARQTQTTVRRCAWNTRIRVAVVHEERRLVRPRPNGQCRQPQTEQYGRRRCPAAVPSRTTHAITVVTTGRVLSLCRRPPALLVSAHPVLAARLSSSSHFPTLRDEVGKFSSPSKKNELENKHPDTLQMNLSPVTVTSIPLAFRAWGTARCGKVHSQ